LEYLRSIRDREVWIIGGGKIYDLFLPIVNKLYITLIDMDIPADASAVRFPDFNLNVNVLETEFHEQNEEDKYSYRTYVMEVV